MAVLRKIKDKIKKMIRESKEPARKRVKKTISATHRVPRILKRNSAVGGRKKNGKDAAPIISSAGISSKDILKDVKKPVHGREEMGVAQTKFSYPKTIKLSRPLPQELPSQYHKDTMVLLVRDPWWLYTYWEVTPETWERFRRQLGDVIHSAKKTLRVYDVTDVIFNGANAHRFFDVEMGYDASNWYIDTGGPNRSWVVDFGLKLPSGEFITILRSNIVRTPSDSPSNVTDEEWMIPDEIFARLYGLGFGFGQSSPVGKAWQERMRKALFSGILSSPGLSSPGSPVRKQAKERKFWLVVDCELIVYGATEPDAAVTVQGRPIKLRPDGTFTLRYALPDGKQVIPVQAVSGDEVEERTITPIVTRETKRENKIRETAHD